MAAIVTDTFVEASDTNITAHTPGGSNPGTGWTLMGSAAANVIGGANLVQDNNTGNGNRIVLRGPLESEDMDVSADISVLGSVAAGNFIFPGIVARHGGPTGGTTGLEFTYDFSIGGGSWLINATSVAEAWPGGSVTMLLSVRGSVVLGYVNGVLKITESDTALRGNRYAGLVLGNFQGDAAKRSRAANFRASMTSSPVIYFTA